MINRILFFVSIWFIGIQAAEAMLDGGLTGITVNYPVVTAVTTSCPFSQCLTITGGNLNSAEQVHFSDPNGNRVYSLNLSSSGNVQILSRTDTEIKVMAPFEIQIPSMANTLVQAADAGGAGQGTSANMPIADQMRGKSAAELYSYMVRQMRNEVGGIAVRYYYDRNNQLRLHENPDTGDGYKDINEAIGVAATSVAIAAILEGKVDAARTAIETANIALGGYLTDVSIGQVADRATPIIQQIKYNNESWLADTSRPLVITSGDQFRTVFQVSPGRFGYVTANGTFVDTRDAYVDSKGRVRLHKNLTDIVGDVQLDPSLLQEEEQTVDDLSLAWGVGTEPLSDSYNSDGTPVASGTGSSGTPVYNPLTYDSYDYQGSTPVIGGSSSSSSSTTTYTSTYGTSEGE